jgi:hypothetical protein
LKYPPQKVKAKVLSGGQQQKLVVIIFRASISLFWYPNGLVHLKLL